MITKKSVPHIRCKRQRHFLLRNVCKYSDFFVLFAKSSPGVENNFDFSLFSRRHGLPVVRHRGAGASRVRPFDEQPVLPRVPVPERVAHLFPFRHLPEVPRFPRHLHAGLFRRRRPAVPFPAARRQCQP